MIKEEKFEKFYNEVINNDAERLEEAKAKDVTRRIITYMVLTILITTFIILNLYFSDKYSINPSPIIVFLVLVIYLNMQKPRKKVNYKHEFKNIVMSKMIKSFDEGLGYYPEAGIRESVYEEAKFESFNIYKTEDLIQGNLNDCKLSIAEVVTQMETTDMEGRKTRIQKFKGIFADIELNKDFNSVIFLRKDKSNQSSLNKAFSVSLISNLFSELRLQLDSQEFEKIFDVYTNNRIVTMQFLTADVMQLLVDFYNRFKIKYELTIRNNHIYIRLWTKNMFEANTSLTKDALDKETLYEYYNVLEFIFDLSNKLSVILNNSKYIN